MSSSPPIEPPPAPAVAPEPVRPAVWLRRRELLPAIVLGVAIALRLWHFIEARSLWLDEARIALNIGPRTFRTLLLPLDHDQTAPPVFLWLVELSTQLFGMGERALRLVPLLAGLGGMLLVWLLARRVLERPAAIVATAIAGLAPTLVFYANELKPYSLDMAVALALLLLAARWLKEPDEPRHYRLLVVAGCIAPWVSSPSLFTLAAIGLAMLIGPARAGGPMLWRTLGVGTIWLSSFGAAYLFFYRATATSAYMLRFWSPSILTPSDPLFVTNFWRALRATAWGFFFGHVGPIYPAIWEFQVAQYATILVLLLIAVGVVQLYRRRGLSQLVLVVGPIMMALLASFAGIYPVAARVMLFSAPLFIYLAVAGVDALVGLLPIARRRAAWWSVGVILLLPPTYFSLEDVALSPRPESTRPLIESFEVRHKSAEPVYLLSASIPAWVYYTTDWSFPDTARLARIARVAGSGGPAFENAPPRLHAVRGEGQGLDWRYGDWREVLGVPTGMEWRSAGRLRQLHPDPCWAEHELNRFIRSADSTGWLLMAHIYWPETVLLRRLDSAGAEILETREGSNAVMLRYDLRRVKPAACTDSVPRSPSPKGEAIGEAL